MRDERFGQRIWAFGSRTLETLPTAADNAVAVMSYATEGAKEQQHVKGRGSQILGKKQEQFE